MGKRKENCRKGGGNEALKGRRGYPPGNEKKGEHN